MSYGEPPLYLTIVGPEFATIAPTVDPELPPSAAGGVGERDGFGGEGGGALGAGVSDVPACSFDAIYSADNAGSMPARFAMVTKPASTSGP